MICPWHKYRIALDTGEGLYMALDGSWKSKGVRQRVHRVHIDESGLVSVRLVLPGDVVSEQHSDDIDGKEVKTCRLASDEYMEKLLSASGSGDSGGSKPPATRTQQPRDYAAICGAAIYGDAAEPDVGSAPLSV